MPVVRKQNTPSAWNHCIGLYRIFLIHLFMVKLLERKFFVYSCILLWTWQSPATFFDKGLQSAEYACHIACNDLPYTVRRIYVQSEARIFHQSSGEGGNYTSGRSRRGSVYVLRGCSFVEINTSGN